MGKLHCGSSHPSAPYWPMPGLLKRAYALLSGFSQLATAEVLMMEAEVACLETSVDVAH